MSLEGELREDRSVVRNSATTRVEVDEREEIAYPLSGGVVGVQQRDGGELKPTNLGSMVDIPEDSLDRRTGD